MQSNKPESEVLVIEPSELEVTHRLEPKEKRPICRNKFPLAVDWQSESYREIPIEMTVALPSLNCQRIIWLALESLRRQTDIKFGWELIVMEEHALSRNIVKNFCGKMPMCQQIRHYRIDPVAHSRKRGEYKGRFLLIDKWIQMALLSDPGSKIFVLQASDCYSPPKRLSIHYQHFLDRQCFFSTQLKGIFYNLQDGKKIIYNGKRTDRWKKISHLNMAMRTADMRKIPTKEIPKGIDNYIRDHILASHQVEIKRNRKHYVFYDHDLNAQNWKYGLDTDGQNQISLARRKHYIKPKKVFEHYRDNRAKYNYTHISDYLPPNVVSFLKSFNQKKK